MNYELSNQYSYSMIERDWRRKRIARKAGIISLLLAFNFGVISAVHFV